jgi:DeoR family transcriptional regulator of aga operon
MADESRYAPAAVRREEILTLVERHGFVRVRSLAKQFEVTEVTIRSDLDALAAGHALQRVHGGAVAGLRSSTHERSFEKALLHYADEKRRIGHAAAGLIRSHQAVMLDSGTTTTAVARALLQREDLEDVVVITNALNIALELEPGHPRLTVVVTGGTLRPFQHSLVAPLADAVLERISADIAFIGCNGVQAEGGVTNMSLPDADMKRRFLQAARRGVIVADSSKIGVTQLSRVTPVNQIDQLITGTGADASALAEIRALDVSITQV